MMQAKQGGGRLVEPLHALAVAVQHHHGIGQRGGSGAVAAQHVEQAALANAHFHLVAVQQAVQLVPDAGAFLGGVPALARGQPAQHAAQPPVMPGQGGQRAQCDAQPQVTREPPHQSENSSTAATVARVFNQAERMWRGIAISSLKCGGSLG